MKTLELIPLDSLEDTDTVICYDCNTGEVMKGTFSEWKEMVQCLCEADDELETNSEIFNAWMVYSESPIIVSRDGVLLTVYNND